MEGCSFDGNTLTENQRDSPSVSAIPTAAVAWVPKVRQFARLLAIFGTKIFQGKTKATLSQYYFCLLACLFVCFANRSKDFLSRNSRLWKTAFRV